MLLMVGVREKREIEKGSFKQKERPPTLDDCLTALCVVLIE